MRWGGQKEEQEEKEKSRVYTQVPDNKVPLKM
jgi:hypothetical protein